MADDLLQAAQKQIDDAAKKAKQDIPRQPSVVSTPPVVNALPPEPPPAPAPQVPPVPKPFLPHLPKEEHAVEQTSVAPEAEKTGFRVPPAVTSSFGAKPTEVPPPPPPPPAVTSAVTAGLPKDTGAAPVSTVTVPRVPRARSSRVGVLLSILLLLFLTIPMGVYYVSQQQQLTDFRSKAASTECLEKCVPTSYTCTPSTNYGQKDCGTNQKCVPASASCSSSASTPTNKPTSGPTETKAPTAKPTETPGPTETKKPTAGPTETKKPTETPGPEETKLCSLTSGAIPLQPCTTPGVKCDMGTCSYGGDMLECVAKVWRAYQSGNRDCSGSCPWGNAAIVNGVCCPTAPDACTVCTGAQYACVEDPYISVCTQWNSSCPAGRTGYFKAFKWFDMSQLSSYQEAAAYYCGSNAPHSCTSTGATATPAPSSPTPTPIIAQCQDIKIYKNGVLVANPSTLQPGDNVLLAVAGTNATKGRIRVNGSPYQETTTTNANGEFTVPFTIPSPVDAPTITIEAEVYRDGEWK